MRKSGDDLRLCLHCLPGSSVRALCQKCTAVFRTVRIVEFMRPDFRSCLAQDRVLLCRQRYITKTAKAFAQTGCSRQKSGQRIGLAVFSGHRPLQVQESAALSQNRDTSAGEPPQALQKGSIAAEPGQVQFRIAAAEIQTVQVFRQLCVCQR